MQTLSRVSSHEDAAYYAIGGDFQTAVERYVVSTPWSRDICNRPELLGCEYTDALRRAMVAALARAPFRDLIADAPQERVCVLNFLRGGLNFDLRNALHEAFGINRHSSAFMSSQRYKVGGRWAVREDMYRKLVIPKDAVMVMGDVVATGVTVENGLDVLAQHIGDIGSSIRGLIFFTIGCHKIEKQLETFDARFRAAFPDYRGTVIVYLEGKFRLVDSRTGLQIGIPGTDLIRKNCPLSPEFEASQYERVAYPLERCTIYDAGSRAFDLPEYVHDVRDYWQKVAALAAGGFSLAAALKERWPEAEYASREAFLAAKRAAWQGVPDAELNALYDAYLGRWTPAFAAAAANPKALADVAAERLAAFAALED